MRLISIYKCLCDETRLRILNLLSVKPLCVCHIQEVLGKPQVKVSQHLSYLRQRGMVTARRHQQWMIYSFPEKPSAELEANLKCLQDCIQTEPIFLKDRAKLKKVLGAESVRPLVDDRCCSKTGVAKGPTHTNRRCARGRGDSPAELKHK
jgi:ArsR family transcriptional regulator, arsenate/arsenite/antimonite-responsive transcriptional repressor